MGITQNAVHWPCRDCCGFFVFKYFFVLFFAKNYLNIDFLRNVFFCIFTQHMGYLSKLELLGGARPHFGSIWPSVLRLSFDAELKNENIQNFIIFGTSPIYKDFKTYPYVF